jgi:hypothetical protein
MMTLTQPAAAWEAQSGWWPSKYSADDQAGALNEITLLLDVARSGGSACSPVR